MSASKLHLVSPALAALVALGACATSSTTPDDFVALAGEWEDLGPARFTSGPPSLTDVEPAPAPAAAPARAPALADDDGAMTIRAVDVHNQRAYRVTIDRADLATIDGWARARGLDQGMRPADAVTDDAIAPAPLAYGWSGNADSRTLRTNTTAWPYRTIGTLFDGGGDCTGTLVGPRHVLTAAHCIYNRNTASWNSITFKPGRNGTNSAPYGSTGPHWYWVPQGYIDGAAGLNGYDIGLIVLDDPIGNGWMGYGAYSGPSLDGVDLVMRGYPRCGVTGAPVKPDGSACDPKTLWGDTQVCALGTFFNTDPDGWNREVKTNCDGSDGQSGSSFYFTSPSTGNPVTMGVFSQHYCLGTCTGDQAQYVNWPNVITRITPTYRDVISYFRSAYPD